MKRIMFLAAMVACSGLLAASAAAAGLEYYGIEGMIRQDFSVHSTVIFKFSEPAGRLDYALGFRVYNLTAESSFPFAECSSADTGTGSVISCEFTGMTETDNKLTLDFDTRDTIDKKEEKNRFSADYSIPFPIERAFMVIKLPENSILSEPVANNSYYPPDGITASDGRRIMIYWEREGMESGGDMEFSVLYAAPDPADMIFNYVTIIIAAVAIVSVASVAVYIKKGRGAAEQQDAIESVLNKNEKSVLAVLNAHGGKAGQKMIVRESGFSKAKVSRLVKNLKERGVVDIEPLSGRENRIMLKGRVPEERQEKGK